MKLSKKLIIGFLAFCASHIATAAPQVLDRVAVQINDGIVLESEVENMMNSIKARAAAAGQSLPDDETLHTQVVERLILTRLQLQTAERIGLNIGDLQLDQAIENIAKKQNITVEQMRVNIEAEGTDFSQYRERLREEVTLGEIQRIQVQRRIQVSPQEITSLVEMIKEQGMKNVEFQVGHILIELPSDPTSAQLEKAKQRASDVLEILNDGADFKKVAITSSSGPKALDGGVWDFMNINELPTLFAEVLTDAKKGDIIGPIKSGSGFHILKVMDTRGLQSQEITEVRSRHVLIKPSPILSEARAQALLRQFLVQIRNGEVKFEDVARQYSEDPGSANKGGELGWSEPSVYVNEFAQALEELDIGQISEPFRSSHGWHIVQLEDRRKTDATDQVNLNRAQQLIFRRKFNEELQNWLDEIRAEAYIKIFNTDE